MLHVIHNMWTVTARSLANLQLFVNWYEKYHVTKSLRLLKTKTPS
jgi:hypothetical protein